VLVAIALPTISGSHQSQFWVYLIGEISGAVLAAGVFTFWSYEKRREETDPLLTGFAHSSLESNSKLLGSNSDRRYDFN
jgi:hypothetical protein